MKKSLLIFFCCWVSVASAQESFERDGVHYVLSEKKENGDKVFVPTEIKYETWELVKTDHRFSPDSIELYLRKRWVIKGGWRVQDQAGRIVSQGDSEQELYASAYLSKQDFKTLNAAKGSKIDFSKATAQYKGRRVNCKFRYGIYLGRF